MKEEFITDDNITVAFSAAFKLSSLNEILYKSAVRQLDLIIFNHLILHVVTHSGHELHSPLLAHELFNSTKVHDELEHMKHIFKTKIMPELERLSEKGTTILILDSEPILPELLNYDKKRNYYINDFNEFMMKSIPELGIKNIHRISITKRTVVGPAGMHLMPDRMHLIRHQDTISISPNLLVNLNIIINFLCNRFEPSDNLCCKNVKVY